LLKSSGIFLFAELNRFFNPFNILHTNEVNNFNLFPEMLYLWEIKIL